MRKFIWGILYFLIFLTSFGVGVVIAAISGDNLVGFDKVDWNESLGTIEKDVTYGRAPLNKFDLYLPANRKHATKLVVYIHAGGFTGGDKADDENIAKYFAAKGYVAATINYSLSNGTNKANVKTMSDEISQGINAIAENAKSRGYKIDGMAVAGGSAGGTLAMIYAYRDAPHALIPVKAVISLVGPATFDPQTWFGIDDNFASHNSAVTGAGFVSVITGQQVTPEMMCSGEYQKVLRPITPASLLTSSAPPTLLAFGALDKVAPFSASKGLIKNLKTLGVPHDVIVFPNSGHGLNRDSDMSKALNSQIDTYLHRYLPLD